jgi:16S rRNA (guanine966-N2)-methyltransferase
MRIIAGERGGMRLAAPRGRATRPTADRVREALFAMLGDVSGVRALDAFAGTGALGLEALSRGAAHAAFWETDAAALRVLRENVRRLGYEDRAAVHRADARRRLAVEAAAGTTYDLLLLDPPYTMLPALQETFSLHLSVLLAPGGLAVLESASAEPPPALPLTAELSRAYGEARVTLYRRA